MEERLQARLAALWPRWKLWPASRRSLSLHSLMVSRIGSSKLMLPRGRARRPAHHGTWRNMFDLHGVAAAIPLPLWVVALVGAGLVGFPYAWSSPARSPTAAMGSLASSGCSS